MHRWLCKYRFHFTNCIISDFLSFRHNSSAGSLRLAFYATLVPMGVFMLMFYFAMLPFKENRSGFKRLHATSSRVYWGSILICDLLLLLFICLLLFGYQVLIMPRELYNTCDLTSIMLSVFFYGLSYLPLLYCLTNIVRTMSALSTCLVTLYYVSRKYYTLFGHTQFVYS